MGNQRVVAAHAAKLAAVATGRIGGASAQAAAARAQRSRNAQPGGNASSEGVIPGIWRNRVPRGLREGTESSSPCV